MSKKLVRHNFLTVRKPKKADTVEQQVAMLTEEIFDIIYGAEKHIKKDLLTLDGLIYSLKYPGHKWRYLSGGALF